MNHHSAPSDDGSEADSGLAPTKVSQPIHTPASEPATAQQLEAVEKQMSSFEKATLKWARLAVFMAAVAALFVCLQWYEMHNGGQDTHDLAVAAKTQAEKTSTMADSADKIRQAAENMVTEAKITAETSQKAMEASNRQSKLSLDESIKAFRLEQRAWVGVSAASLVQFEPDKPIRIDVLLLNTGKTPAVQAYASNGYVLSRTYLKEPPSESVVRIEKVLTTKPVHSLPPNGSFIAPLGLQPAAGPSAAPEEWASYNILRESYPPLKDRVQMLYVFGEYRYRDINNRPHTTKFCLFISDPDAKQLQFCEGFNEMD